MAPSRWDDEEEDSTPPSSPPAPVAVRRGKFDDEEDDSDVLDSWDKEEDSETERAKAAAAAAAKARAEAEAAKNKKSKSQRIEEKRMENMRRRQEEEDAESSEEEDEATKRERLRRTEKDSDLKHAQDLFGSVSVSKDRSALAPVTLSDPSDPTKTIELSSLQLFNPQTRDQFVHLRETLVPLIAGQNWKKAQYASFVTEFVKQLVKDLPSDQIKKIASGLTTVSNEKMKEEKAAEKGNKKSKAAKTKTTLNASRDTALKADTNAYDDGLDEDDFM